MIIYNKIWLDNLRLQAQVKNDHRLGCINDAELKHIIKTYPVGFYSPNIWGRVGLFILTFIIALFSGILLSLLFMSSHLVETFGWFFFLGLLSHVALEFIVRNKHHYQSGVDDALTIITWGLFIGGFSMAIFNTNTNYQLLSASIFLLSICLSIRFADMLMSALSCISFFAFIFFTWTSIIPLGLVSIPFVMMTLAAATYWLAVTSSNKLKFINYDICLAIVQIISLVTLYAAGNYYVIQTLSNELHGVTTQNGQPVPFGPFFWGWTILLPFVYTVFGIKRKDAILLRIGMLLIIAAGATFRTYYQVLPVEIALTLIGAILLIIAFSIIKYLHTPKHGFTYAETDDEHLMDHIKVESLIIAETFSQSPAAPKDEGFKYGGGDFGGGGSSGNF